MASSLRRRLKAGLAAVLLGVCVAAWARVDVEAQGPFSAQIQRALAAAGIVPSGSGTATFSGTFLSVDGTASAPGHGFISATNTGMYLASGGLWFTIGGSNAFAMFRDTTSGLLLGQISPLSWGSSGVGSPDTYLFRGGAGILEDRNSTNAQVLRVFNTYTSASSGEYFGIDWQSIANVVNVGTRTGSAGGSIRRAMFTSQSSAAGTSFSGLSVIRAGGANPDIGLGVYTADGVTVSTTGQLELIRLADFISNATSGTVQPVTIKPQYNQSASTAANTDLTINRTETSLGSGTQRLIAGQVGGVDKFAISNTGIPTVLGGFTTAGDGVPIIVASARATAQTGANASVVTFTPTSDTTIEAHCNVLVTASTTHSFTAQLTFTDEGNTARTFGFSVTGPAGIGFQSGGAITNTNGAVPYACTPIRIRVKASTAVTLLTTGTFTSVTYNVEGQIAVVR